jgi:DNA mismatch repair protein PMS2
MERSRAEVRFKEYGLGSIEVIDNGSGVAPKDYESIGECIYRCQVVTVT